MKSNRISRHKRIRAKIKGTAERPRLSIFRSLKHMEAQLINDSARKTILGMKDLKIKKGTKTNRAAGLGEAFAKEILAKGYKKIVFDRGGYQYHGRIKVLAEALRKGGVEF
ncbi:50S ribosomal protein L18 [Candidatus Giovannonibacteria bacterium RIFCSPLOWO2_02_FULL_45_14]|uniref:Large ribosomal subunit protein uL18 n=3 Tax=Parcubacteria group TaxID=1794811 RepID=A0A0H4TXF0_9BACT|nr:50S ribosomal protein L18, large subunit ribosomal protein L18 [uncultured Parcubacteria bacterium Rifle_16ft_4_minimus_37658]AKQ05709.1 50S ribosomal protein L18, large subunit ribosomal protein L18 [uncultured Parcubacteria bacterium Rifle_16ft_4_minimus_23641]OGF70240.1 MAG: 50S ribosomal protein L18 [Candidatus Giovannonibacteria bacterium RIFCSPHIGHO2_02_FULL_44_31]OGF76325.1 MAG: 50S ribosomal protein L18 [Candidatus Giovannonibacteria bacterium RIFCSPHIGHO2_12_FULL_44_29]OGF90623.1 MA